MSRWLHERQNEYYYNKAKEEGYRSRASYKLKQLNEEYHFFRDAKRVLDLGAAPGGWLQVAAEAVGGDGIVIGLDLKEIEPLENENVETIVGDITDPKVQEEVLSRFEGKVDVVLSDMAPNVMGVWELDDLRQIHLARTALRIADRLLREDGWMIVKVFQGKEHESFIREMRAMFRRIYIVKPMASRKRSAEVYVVAKNLREDRILPQESRGNGVTHETAEEKKSLPGENLPDYGGPKEYKKG